MKRTSLYHLILLMFVFASCSKSKFAEYYQNPSSTSTTTPEKQWTGFNQDMIGYESPQYYAYFVEWQTTTLNFTQVTAYENITKRYEPLFQYAAGDDKWNHYYDFMTQYRNFVSVYSALPATAQAQYRVFKITADIHLYDQTQKMVDTYGDLPWSKAGLITTNGGNIAASYATYDKASDIYQTMLDSLQQHAAELNTIATTSPLTSAIATIFKSQDFIDSGKVVKWQKYCNSLRIRMLMRVSGVSQFSSRANTEIASILADPTTYPICNGGSTTAGVFGSGAGGYADGIYVVPGTAFRSSMNSNSSPTGGGLVGWGYADRTTKTMIDTLVNNKDPRLHLLFQPGSASGDSLIGLDENLDAGTQSALLTGNKIALYNYGITSSTLLPVQYFTSQEIQLLIADYYTNVAPNASLAGQAYNAAITNSTYWYNWLFAMSDNKVPINGSYVYTAPTDAQIATYINSSNMKWDPAATTDRKNELIGLQKWINYNVFEPIEVWSELRRTGYPTLTFVPDNTSTLAPLPSNRFYYPVNEVLYNTTNYNAATNSGATNIPTTKIFWQP